MFGTLIGIFITSAGIVVGADSVLWGSSAPAPTRVEKTCQLGPRAAAALEGWYGENLSLHRRFQEACEALRRSSNALSVEDRADRLIAKLKQAYEAHAGAVPVKSASLPPPGSKHVVSIVVAGFDGTTPLATVREIRWDRSRKGTWRLVAERTGKLSFQDCGAEFLGEAGVAALLLDTSPHFEKEKQRREMRAASKANHLRKQESCFLSTFSIEDAKALYKTAVRLTIDHAERFFIQNGAVGGRLHLLTLPRDGIIEEEWIDPERYVGEAAPSSDTVSELTSSPEGAGGESS